MNNLFSSYHPLVGFSYLAVAIVLCMAAFHPVYVAMSFIGGLASSFVFRKVKPTLRSLPWMLLLWAFITLFNTVFS